MSEPGDARRRITLIVGILVLGVLIVLFLPAVPNAVKQSPTTQCANNVRHLVLGVLMYCQDYDGYAPEELHCLLPYVNNEWRVFLCPSDAKSEEELQHIRENLARVDVFSSYQILGGFDIRRLTNPAQVMVVYERATWHEKPRAGRNAGFADGHVEFLPPQRFRELHDYSLEAIEKAREKSAQEGASGDQETSPPL